ETVSVMAHEHAFHNKKQFESLHGVNAFYDMAHFPELGFPAEGFTPWGVEDRDFLEGVFRIFDRHAESGKGLFAHALTSGTHYPQARREDVALSNAVLS